MKTSAHLRSRRNGFHDRLLAVLGHAPAVALESKHLSGAGLVTPPASPYRESPSAECALMSTNAFERRAASERRETFGQALRRGQQTLAEQ